MRTGQALFSLRIKPSIPQIRPWKELLATGAQATWLKQKNESKTFASNLRLEGVSFHLCRLIFFPKNVFLHSC